MPIPVILAKRGSTAEGAFFNNTRAEQPHIPLTNRDNMSKSIKRILVLRFRRVGDAVLSAVICSSLKKTFPHAKIDYVLNENIGSLFLNHPDIDGIITFDNRELGSVILYCRKVYSIMCSRYDMIIDTRATVKTLLFSLLSPFTPYRIGKRKFYNMLIQNYRIDNSYTGVGNILDTNLQLLSPLEKEYPVVYEREFRLYPTAAELSQFRRYMETCGVDFVHPVIFCDVTSRVERKSWSFDRMRELLFRILSHYDCQLVFNDGTGSQQLLARRLHTAMDNSPRIFTNIKTRNLRDLSLMIANTDFFFGNEGGPRHISQALDIPSFAIFPPGILKKEWLPGADIRFQGIEPSDVLPESLQSNLSYAEKFDLLTVDAVWERLDVALKNHLCAVC
jgi:heptosyltransferase-2